MLSDGLGRDYSQQASEVVCKVTDRLCVKMLIALWDVCSVHTWLKSTEVLW